MLGDAESAAQESFVQGCWTARITRGRRSYEGVAVPAVLMSGNHAEIERWRLKQSLGRTWERRPDLLGGWR